MFEFEIDTSDVERAVETAQRKFQADIHSAVEEAARAGAEKALNTRIYQDRTAQLTASIGHGEFRITSNGAECLMFAYEKYASYVNEWEAGQLSDGFMDRGAEEAERILIIQLNRAIRFLEIRINNG